MNVVFHFIAKKYPFIYYFFRTACPMSKKKKKKNFYVGHIKSNLISEIPQGQK